MSDFLDEDEKQDQPTDNALGEIPMPADTPASKDTMSVPEPSKAPEMASTNATGQIAVPTEQPKPAAPAAAPAMDGKKMYQKQRGDIVNAGHAIRGQMTGLDPSDPSYLQKLAALQTAAGVNKKALLEFDNQHPWGSPESAHPGFMGKVGHVLGEIGNVAGTALAPELTAAIPGSHLNMGQQANAANAQIKQGEETYIGEQDARAKLTAANAKTTNLALEQVKNPDGTDRATNEGYPVQEDKNTGQQYVLTPGGPMGLQDYLNGKPLPGAQAAPQAQAAPTMGQAPVQQAPQQAPPATGTIAVPSQAPPPAPAQAPQGRGIAATTKALGDTEVDAANAQNTAQYQQAFGNSPLPAYFQIRHGADDAHAKETTAALQRLVATNDANEQRKIMNAQRKATEEDTQAQRAETNSRERTEDVNKEVDKAQAQVKPILDKGDAKIEQLQEAVNMLDKPNGEKDALAPVKALVATAGGMGSGVRVTMPELQQIATARGWTESADVTLNNIFDPSSYEKMSDSQRTQLKGIIGDVYQLVESKNDAAHSAYAEITGSRSIPEVRTAQEKFNQTIQSMNRQAPGSTQGDAKGAAAKLHANMGDFVHQYAGKKGTIFSDDGKTWYDASGNLVK